MRHKIKVISGYFGNLQHVVSTHVPVRHIKAAQTADQITNNEANMMLGDKRLSEAHSQHPGDPQTWYILENTQNKLMLLFTLCWVKRKEFLIQYSFHTLPCAIQESAICNTE